MRVERTPEIISFRTSFHISARRWRKCIDFLRSLQRIYDFHKPEKYIKVGT